MVYHISYDLNKPAQNYPRLYEAIKQLGVWCHPGHSTWYVETNLSADQIRNTLESVMGRPDELLVTVAKAPAAWFGLTDEVSAWLKNHL